MLADAAQALLGRAGQQLMTPALNATHDAKVRSWVASANDSVNDFPIQNLPLGIFRRRATGEVFRGEAMVSTRAANLWYSQKTVFVEAGGRVNRGDWLHGHLKPAGTGVVVVAEHLCMTLRGARAGGATTVTSALHGVLLNDPRARGEFFALSGITP